MAKADSLVTLQGTLDGDYDFERRAYGDRDVIRC